MKKLVLASLFVVGLSVQAQQAQDDDHTPNYCSAVQTTVCAHLGHMTALNTTDEVQFVAHVMTPSDVQVTDLKVELWMEMGSHSHPGSPVTLTQFGVNKYRVTEAYFVMSGTWTVRLTFNFDGQKQQINIPLTVK